MALPAALAVAGRANAPLQPRQPSLGRLDQPQPLPELREEVRTLASRIKAPVLGLRLLHLLAQAFGRGDTKQEGLRLHVLVQDPDGFIVPRLRRACRCRIHTVQIAAERQDMEKGIEQGLQQGLLQGMQPGQAKIMASNLKQRFGELPPWAQAKLDSGSDAQMEAWSKALLSASTVAEVFSAGQH